MAPLVQRTWSPKGQTPVLYQRTRSHKKASVIAALCVASNRKHLQLFFRLHKNMNITSTLVLDFLRHLLRQLEGHVLVIWDRFSCHRAKGLSQFIQRNRRLHIALLPPYAPELNPAENIWGYMKCKPLANFAPSDLDSLARVAGVQGRSMQRKQKLLRSFLKHSPLFLRLS